MSAISVAVKVRHVGSGEVRRFRLNQSEDSDLFGDLIAHIHDLFGSKGIGRVSYVDSDGDTIVMTSTSELMEAIRLSPSLLTIQWNDAQKEGRKEVPASSLPPLPSGTPSHHEEWSSESDDDSDDDFDEMDDRMECENGTEDHFDKKRRKIEQKIAKVRDSNKPEEKKAHKIEKLERKLEKVEKKEELKATKRHEDLHKRLAKIEKAILRNEAKQQQVRCKLTELEGCPQFEKRVFSMRTRLEKLEKAHTQLVSRRDSVRQRVQIPTE